MRQLKVALVDDHGIVRQGIRNLLEQEDNLKVVGEAGDGLMAINLIEKTDPDLVLMDVMMPHLNGIDAASNIRKRSPKTKIIFLTMQDNAEYALRALKAGAMGYVLKHGDFSEILTAINMAIDGKRYVSSPISDEVLEMLLTAEEEVEKKINNQLTPREVEVLQLIAEGHTNRAIAKILTLSVRTVEVHRAKIMVKIKAHSQADLVRYAIQNGMVQS